jgi:hypothetical protein
MHSCQVAQNVHRSYELAHCVAGSQLGGG